MNSPNSASSLPESLKTVLVTGNLGYIGSVLVPMLVQKGFRVIGYDLGYYGSECFLYAEEQPLVKQILKDVRDVSSEDFQGVDAVIHLAGLSNDPLGEFNPELTRAINYEGTIKMALAAKDAGVKRFIYASSQSMYGVRRSGDPVKESDPVDTSVIITEYARTKWDAECVLHKLHSSDFTVVCFRPSTVFGASPKFRSDIVFNNLVACAYATGKIEIKSDGTPWRPVVHVRDVSNAFIAGIIAPKELVANQSYNVGIPNGNFTVRDLAEAAQRCVPGSVVVFTGEHGPDSRTYRVSFDKILTELKDYYRPEWDLLRGGKELADTFRRVNLTEADFRGRKFIRLSQLKYLVENGTLDRCLRKVDFGGINMVNESGRGNSAPRCAFGCGLEEDLSPLRKYVLTVKNKEESALQEVGRQWMTLAARNRLQYEFDWFGVPIIQTPEDIVLMQEVVYRTKPDVIVELGLAHGGGAIFYASLLELLGKGKVIGVDIEIRKHNREVLERHPLYKRIELLERSSIIPETVAEIKQKIPPGAKVMVCFDSNHTRDHVSKELELYSPLVTVGSYALVFDTVTSELVEMGAADEMYRNNGPMEAINLFLKKNPDFIIDKSYNKLYIAQARDGFLKRIK